MKATTTSGKTVTLTPQRNQIGQPEVKFELNGISGTFGRMSWDAKNNGVRTNAIVNGKFTRVLLTIPKDDFDAVVAEAASLKDQSVAGIKNGKTPISVRWQQGSPLSAYAVSGDAADVLKELGLARDVSGWGTTVDDWVVRELGESFTFDEAAELARPQIEAKAQKAEAAKQKVQDAIEKAVATQQPVKIDSEAVQVDEPENSLTIVTRWAMPDGTVETSETRTY